VTSLTPLASRSSGPPCRSPCVLRRINEIVHGKRAITADTALRLGCYFDVEPQFWLNLQSRYELELAEDRAAGELDAIKPIHAA